MGVRQAAYKQTAKGRAAEARYKRGAAGRAARKKHLRAYRAKLRLAALSVYSNGAMECAVCAIRDADVLALDHVRDDGASHRRQFSGVTTSLFLDLQRRGFPPGFQVLCHNCNWRKELRRRRRGDE